MDKESLDEYGKGRLSVIKEIREYCQNNIVKLRDSKIEEQSYTGANQSGQRKAYFKILNRLEEKEQKLKEKK